MKSILRNPYTVALALILLGMAIQQALRSDPGAGAHLSVGLRLITGEDIYPPETPFVYPPFSSVLMVPLAFVPLHAAQVLWCIVSCVALAVMLRSAWSLSGGGRLDRFDKPFIDNHLIVLLGCLCALRFSFNALQHISLDLVIGMLIMLGGITAVRNRFRWTAVLWGLAAAFKGPPLLFAGYLVWRRKWSAALLMILVTICVNLLPDLVAREPNGTIWATRWFYRFIEPLGESDYTPGAWNADILDNQSVAGAANRWFMTVFYPSQDGITVFQREYSISRQSLKFIVYGVDLLFCLAVALSMRPGGFRLQPRLRPSLPSRPPLEFSVVILLILLLSPMSSRSLFCTMILPAFCVARAAVIGGNRIAWVSIAVAIIGSIVSFNAPFARTFNREMLWLGIVTMTAVSLLVGCLWLLLQHRGAMRPAETIYMQTSEEIYDKAS